MIKMDDTDVNVNAVSFIRKTTKFQILERNLCPITSHQPMTTLYILLQMLDKVQEK